METFALAAVAAMFLLAIYSIWSTGRMAREAMRRQADMERLLVVTDLSRRPETQSAASLVATMSEPEPTPQRVARVPVSQPRDDRYGYDLDQELQG